MNVLMIGQLPKEVGGNYTTGAANVVYELSKHSSETDRIYTFATNAPDDKVVSNASFSHQYIGYKKNISIILKDAFTKPISLLMELRHYWNVDHINPLRLLFCRVNIQRAIRLVNPDIIHVHSIGNVSVTKYACGKQNIPLILTCHGIFYRGEDHDFVNKQRYYGNLPYCDYYTGLTEESRLEYKKYLGIEGDKLTIVPNGVDTSKFYFSLAERKYLREKFGVKDNQVLFITVASLQQRKGQYDFLKVLKQLDEDWQYWLIGKGEDEGKITQYIKDNQLETKVHLLGYINSGELYKFYSAADIYAHVSYKEGQSLSEIEAFATGLNTIVNKKIKNTLAIQSNSDNYKIIDLDDFDYTGVIEWLNRGNNRQTRSNLDWSIISEKYRTVYHTIINRKRHGVS